MTLTQIEGKKWWRRRWQVTSDRVGRDGEPVVYVVGESADNIFGCSCPAWKFQRGPRTDCKHIDEVKVFLIRQNLAVRAPAAMTQEERNWNDRLVEAARIAASGRPMPTGGRKAPLSPARAAAARLAAEPPASEVERPRRKFRFER